MSDPGVVNQLADSDVDRAELCGECCIQEVTRWGGRVITADDVANYTRGTWRGEAGVQNGTDAATISDALDHFQIPHYVHFIQPCGDVIEDARTNRGHLCMAAINWDGIGSLGGRFGHWVLSTPSGRIANSYGGVYNYWSRAGLNLYGQSLTIEFLFGEDGLAVNPAPKPTVSTITENNMAFTFRPGTHEVHQLIVGQDKATWHCWGDVTAERSTWNMESLGGKAVAILGQDFTTDGELYTAACIGTDGTVWTRTYSYQTGKWLDSAFIQGRADFVALH